MSDASKPFDFSQFVPGFGFLKDLASGVAGGTDAAPSMSSLSSWVAPTVSVEKVDKHIQDLKTVQYWLEQNGHALKATIQALEVQKMTLSTLRGMNVRMEDLASVFTRPAVPPAPAPEPEVEDETEAEAEAEADETPAAGVVDPLQWWGALTQQFQQIANSALQDASQLKVPAMAQPLADVLGKAMNAAAPAKTARKPAAARKKPAVKTPAAKATPRKRTRAR